MTISNRWSHSINKQQTTCRKTHAITVICLHLACP